MSTGAPIEKGIPIRMPSQALLCVDSADGEQYNAQGFRIDTNSPSDIYINRQRPLLAGYLTRIELTEINFQWYIPNVNETNNTLTLALYTALGAVQEYVRLTIPRGFYTAAELARAVKTALNASAGGGALAMTYNVLIGGLDPNTGTANTTQTCSSAEFLITRTGGTGFFRIVPFNLSSSVSGLPVLADDLTNMMGLTPSNAAGLSAYYSSIQSSYASMLYTPYIDIVSNLLTKNQNVQDGDTAKFTTASKLARVYFANNDWTPRVVTITYDGSGAYASSTDNSLGCVECALRREFQTPKVIQWNSTENVDIIDLQLRDYRGNLLPIEFLTPAQVVPAPGQVFQINANTADFQFTLMATEV